MAKKKRAKKPPAVQGITPAMRKALSAAGRIGGAVRAARLTPERRRQIAANAVAAREKKRRPPVSPPA